MDPDPGAVYVWSAYEMGARSASEGSSSLALRAPIAAFLMALFAPLSLVTDRVAAPTGCRHYEYIKTLQALDGGLAEGAFRLPKGSAHPFLSGIGGAFG